MDRFKISSFAKIDTETIYHHMNNFSKILHSQTDREQKYASQIEPSFITRENFSQTMKP